jgi:hypothetical protein
MLGGMKRAGTTADAFSRGSGSGSGRPEPGDLGKEVP